VLPCHPFDGQFEALLLYLCLQGARNHEEIVLRKTSAGSHVLEQQVPRELIEVGVILGDPRLGLPLVEDDGIYFQWRVLDQGEDSIANCLPVFCGVKRLYINACHGQFVARIEQLMCNGNASRGDGANCEVPRPLWGKSKVPRFVGKNVQGWEWHKKQPD